MISLPANYVLLERIELAASAASIVFANIPQSGYTDLKVVASPRGTVSIGSAGLNIQFNGLTTNLSWRRLLGNGSSASSASSTGGARIAELEGSDATASTFGNYEVYIPNYTSSNFKSFSSDAVNETNATTEYMGLYAGLWSATSAITSITLVPSSGSLAQYSTFSLYGLAAVGTTPVIAPKATGGNRIDNDGTYWYHTYTSTGSFTPLQGLSCDALVIAGGGSSGIDWVPAGGGAGGLRGLTAQSFPVNSYTITVGGGGSSVSPTNGSNSTITASGFTTISASGGGSGAVSAGNKNGVAGGSGGGGYGESGNAGTGGAGNTGSYSPVEGYAGAPGTTGGSYQSGGGGGASGTPASPSANNGGAGGAGSSAYSSWASATSTGVSGSYAGGGGGSGESTGGTGGAGGGGNGRGRSTGTSTAGTINTGSGGGGGFVGAQSGSGGGSGIVIIRYPIA